MRTPCRPYAQPPRPPIVHPLSMVVRRFTNIRARLFFFRYTGIFANCMRAYDRFINCTSTAPLRTRVRMYCVRMCVCRVRRPQHPSPSRLMLIGVPPPSLPGAHVCGTPIARILFRRWVAAISDSHCYAAIGGASRGTPTDLNNEDNVLQGYYAIFVINVIELGLLYLIAAWLDISHELL